MCCRWCCRRRLQAQVGSLLASSSQQEQEWINEAIRQSLEYQGGAPPRLSSQPIAETLPRSIVGEVEQESINQAIRLSLEVSQSPGEASSAGVAQAASASVAFTPAEREQEMMDDLPDDELIAILLQDQEWEAAPQPPLPLPLTEAICPICMEARPLFEVSPCGHGVCVRCAVTYVRTALRDARAQVKAEGIRCTTPGCTTFITPDVVRRLVIESRDVSMPATSSFAGPMSVDEVDRFDDFVVEASVPFGQKMHCPQCERLAIFDVAPGEQVSCPYCGNNWNYKAHTGEDQATAETIRATSKACPNCGMRITHYHGHDCHHITPGTGCPGCGQHFCYVCLRKHGTPGNRQWNAACEHRQSFCINTDICSHVVATPFPHDSRCGCPICPDCRPSRPCSQCPGNCVVCRGLIRPASG